MFCVFQNILNYNFFKNIKYFKANKHTLQCVSRIIGKIFLEKFIYFKSNLSFIKTHHILMLYIVIIIQIHHQCFIISPICQNFLSYHFSVFPIILGTHCIRLMLLSRLSNLIYYVTSCLFLLFFCLLCKIKLLIKLKINNIV